MQGIVIYVTGFSQLSWFSTSFDVANHYWWIRQKDLYHNRFIALIGNSFFVVVADNYFPSNQWVLSIMKGVHFHWFGNTGPKTKNKGGKSAWEFYPFGVWRCKQLFSRGQRCLCSIMHPQWGPGLPSASPTAYKTALWVTAILLHQEMYWMTNKRPALITHDKALTTLGDYLNWR